MLVPAREHFPDFLIVFHAPKLKPMEYESVWADEKGREVENEYRAQYACKSEWEDARQAATAAGRDDPGEYLELIHYDPAEKKAQAREAIRRVVGNKAAKGYPVTTRLVVRNNLGALTGLEYHQITKPWHERFREIWILKAPLLWRAKPSPQTFGDGARNDTSLALHVQLRNGPAAGRALLLGDLAHETLTRIFAETKRHKNGDRLLWEVLLSPHHCSKFAMYVKGASGDD